MGAYVLATECVLLDGCVTLPTWALKNPRAFYLYLSPQNYGWIKERHTNNTGPLSFERGPALTWRFTRQIFQFSVHPLTAEHPPRHVLRRISCCRVALWGWLSALNFFLFSNGFSYWSFWSRSFLLSLEVSWTHCSLLDFLHAYGHVR